MNQVTRILSALERGEEQAAEELLPLVYDELRRLAQWQMSRELPGQTLQATALVHEAWLRLAGNGESNWDSRRHFFRRRRKPCAGSSLTLPAGNRRFGTGVI